MAATSNIQSWQPNLAGKIHPAAVQAIQLLYSAIQDHDTAIVGLNGKVTTPATPTPVANTAPTPSAPSSPSSSFPGLGKVNAQAGNYTTQVSDAGSLITITSASISTVTLSSIVGTPFFCFVTNLGTADVTLTPNSGKINGGASFTLPPTYSCIPFFDGVNWEAFILPLTTLALKTNGTANGKQSLLNLVAGSNVTLTDSGTGNITVAAAAGSAPVITTNSNGTAVAYSGGYVHQFGKSAASPTGVAKSTVAVTFPVAFAGIPVVICNVDNNADSFGTSVFSCYPSAVTTTGFTANFAAGVIIGGTGAANITNVVHAGWEADFA